MARLLWGFQVFGDPSILVAQPAEQQPAAGHVQSVQEPVLQGLRQKLQPGRLRSESTENGNAPQGFAAWGLLSHHRSEKTSKRRQDDGNSSHTSLFAVSRFFHFSVESRTGGFKFEGWGQHLISIGGRSEKSMGFPCKWKKPHLNQCHLCLIKPKKDTYA